MSAVYFFECIACGGELPPKVPAKFDLCPACEAKYLASKTAHVALALAVRQWIQNELDAKAGAATKAKVVGALRLVEPDGEVSR